MCFGENCAPQAVYFINAQLDALYHNAVECLSHHSNAASSEEPLRYAHALADFYFGQYEDRALSETATMFQASFDKPRLEFICNHDAFLYLRIRKGHYHLDCTHDTTTLSSDKNRIQQIEQVEIKFRVSFTVREVDIPDLGHGNRKSLMRFVILDLLNARLMTLVSEASADQDALGYYLMKYLEFLQSAGQSVLFSLPDFDASDLRLTIDHSFMGGPVDEVGEICGASVEAINTQLSSSWLKAAMLADDCTDQTSDWTAVALAEYRGSWTVDESDIRFHLKFGTPLLSAICSKEAELLFKVDEVSFEIGAENTDDLTQCTGKGLEIAIVADVVQEECDGVLIRKIDSQKAQICMNACSIPDLDGSDEDNATCKDRLLKFFDKEYLTCLENNNNLVIYDPRSSASIDDEEFPIEPTPPEGDEESSDAEPASEGDGSSDRTTDSKLESWKQLVTKSDTHGFDQVIAVSQRSINAQFRRLWRLATASNTEDSSQTLASWKFEDFFSATFKPMMVRLLSNSRAIVWVYVEKGDMKLLKNKVPWRESKIYELQNWKIAFEVDLKMTTDVDLSDAASSLFSPESQIFELTRKPDECDLQHVLLDFSSAQFLHEYSHFDGLLQSQGDARPIDQVHAVLHYLRDRYLAVLQEACVNVFLTIPVWRPGSALPSFGLTDAVCRIYSKEVVTRQNWSQVASGMEPAVLILGMMAFRPLPSTTLEDCNDWAIDTRKGLSEGTVSFSRDAVIDQGLLASLAFVNSITTVSPIYSPVDEDGAWALQFVAWARDERRKRRECRWVLEELNEDGTLRWKWWHRVAFTYEQEGDDVVSAACSASSETRNYVQISATGTGHSLDIKVGGDAKIAASFDFDTSKRATKSSAKWSASLTLETTEDGLQARIVDVTAPSLEPAETEGDGDMVGQIDLHSSLASELPSTIDLTDVLASLRQFEGEGPFCFSGMHACMLANPALNSRGDVVFELRSNRQRFGSVPTSPSSLSTDISNSQESQLVEWQQVALPETSQNVTLVSHRPNVMSVGAPFMTD